MSSRARGVFSLFLAAIFLAGCARQDEPSDNQLKNQKEPRDACSLLHLAETVLGPVEFQRGTGKPETESAAFQVPLDGELCLVVTNGLHDPPQGSRVSAAWINVDGALAIGPDAFSQVVERIQQPLPIGAGGHELSVKLASKPGSFITVEIRFLRADDEPPQVTLSPEDGAALATDIPLLTVGYTDEGLGVDTSTLAVSLNGEDITGRFAIDLATATYQVTYESVLPEGLNLLQAEIADWRGNVGYAVSVFLVATPTEVLLADLKSGPPAAARRAAIKLLDRRDDLGVAEMRLVLKVVTEQRIVAARDKVVSVMLDRSLSPLTRAMAAAALGEIAEVDTESRTTDVISTLLIDALENDPSWAVRAAAIRSLGQTLRQDALDAVQRYIEPPLPPMPSAHDQVAFEYTKLLALQALVRLSGDDSLLHNSPTWQDLQDEALGNILQYFQQFPR